MDVKDFITQHPGATLEMMTPGGYVNLTPEKAQALLGGESTTGHPGSPAHAMKIEAEELLAQQVHSANLHEGVWCLLTGYSQEETQESTILDPSEILERLNEKLDRNYQDFVNGWLKMEPPMLIEHAEESAATKQVYDELKGNEYNMAYFEYLLRFENPLEVVRDKWIEEHELPACGDMDHALWYLMDKRDAEQDYELDEGYKPPGMDQGVTMC